MVQKIAQYKSFVQKEIGVKYRVHGSCIPFKPCDGMLINS